MQVFIGYDAREQPAYDVATHTLYRKSGLEAIPLDEVRLRRSGVLTRTSVFKDSGQQIDIISRAPMSTDFAISRFLTPILCQRGYALFTDCDVVFLDDVRMVLASVDPKFAVSVVKHAYIPSSSVKMQGMVQTSYSRKNWSSVMLFNCDHPANARLSLVDVNTRTGRDLHAFYWLHDNEIGQLHPRWNWLVGEQVKPDSPAIAHFTLGGPWIPNWVAKPHDAIWTEAYRETTRN